MLRPDRSESGGGRRGEETRADGEWTGYTRTSKQSGVTHETSNLRGSHTCSQPDQALVRETRLRSGKSNSSLDEYRQLRKDAEAIIAGRWDRTDEPVLQLDGGARKMAFQENVQALQDRGFIPPLFQHDNPFRVNEDSDDEGSFKDGDDEQTPSSTPPLPERVAGFASIEFEEGTRYISSYKLVIGRDEALYQRLLKLHGENEEVLKELENGNGYTADLQPRQDVLQDTSLFPGLQASDLPDGSNGPANQDDDAGPTGMQRMTTGKRASTSSQSSKDSSSDVPNSSREKNESSNLHTADVGGDAIEAPPPEIPQRLDLPFWPEDQDDLAPGLLKSISNVHAKIVFNEGTGRWDLKVRGRNGLWVNDEYFPTGSRIPLKNDDLIQIAYIPFKFVLPPEADSSTGTYAKMASEALSMSHEFGSGRGEGQIGSNEVTSDSYSSRGRDRRDEESETPRSQSQGLETESGEEDGPEKTPVEEDDDEVEVEEDDEAAALPPPKRKPIRAPKRVSKASKAAPKTKAKKSKPAAKAKDEAKARRSQKVSEALPTTDLGIPPEMIPPRRKGPGRPPKNGIMSKREENMLKKKVKEEERRKAIENGTLKPGKEQGMEPPRLEKRKYTKRKKPEFPDEAGDGIVESLEVESEDQKDGIQDASKVTKGKKPPARQPLSPSPEFDEATLTKEQLAKPTISYYWILYEILSKATRPMSLSSIYHAAQRLYPYFKFVVTSPGWQSSIRHNLLQNNIFMKACRDGKGFLWGLNPDVSVEREKKRRPSPPPDPPPTHYPQGPQMQHPYPYPGFANGQQPPPNNQMPVPPTFPNGYVQPPHGHPSYSYPPRIPPGRGFPPPGMNSMPLPLSIPQPSSNSTYQSPYASAPRPEQKSPHDRSATQQPQTRDHPPSQTHSNGYQDAASNGALSTQPPPNALESVPSNQRTFEDLVRLIPHKKFSELDYPSQECIMFFRRGVGINMADNPNATAIAEMAINSYFEDAFPDRKHPGEDVYGPREEAALVRPLLDMLVNLRGQRARASASQPLPSNPAAAAGQTPQPQQTSTAAHPPGTVAQPQQPQQPQASIVATAASAVQATSLPSPSSGIQKSTAATAPDRKPAAHPVAASQPGSPAQPLPSPHLPDPPTPDEASAQGGLSELIDRMRNAPTNAKSGPGDGVAGKDSAGASAEVASTTVGSKRAIGLVAGGATEPVPAKRPARDA